MNREQLTRVLDLAEAGTPPAAIARATGISYDTVRQACRARGVPLVKSPPRAPGCPWTAADDVALRELFALRRTDTEIARALGRSAWAVCSRRRALRLYRGTLA